MAAITASMVAELRAKTDAPMMECKKALTEAGGDMSKAEEILRPCPRGSTTTFSSPITCPRKLSRKRSLDANRSCGAVRPSPAASSSAAVVMTSSRFITG
mgnify:CR=1 FL=1